jgi:hypothetical protein
MGYYGNAGGTSCDGTNGGLTTSQLIAQSLGNWGGSLTVGRAGHSVVMNNNAGDIGCIIAQLPGVSTPKELPAGDLAICNLPASLLAGGKIKNVLLGQTITLGLNLGITSPSQLAGFPLQAGVLATQDLLGECGTTTPKIRVCVYNPESPYNLTGVINEYTYGSIDQTVIDAIVGTKNVAGLFALANDALANTDNVVGSENGATLGLINTAVNTINVGFDKCKAFIGWDVEACAPINPNPLVGGKTNTTTVSENLVVYAFPNPYGENFTLKINSPVSGNARVEFFTMDGGHKISEMAKPVLANTEAFVVFKIPTSVYRSRIVYVVTVGNFTQRGIVLSPN